jgi:hypothetical protein
MITTKLCPKFPKTSNYRRWAICLKQLRAEYWSVYKFELFGGFCARLILNAFTIIPVFLTGTYSQNMSKVNVYRFNGKKAVMERRHSDKEYKDVINLYIYSDLNQKLHHFSYIINLPHLTKVFQCPECYSFFSEFKKIKRNLIICKKPKIIFKEGNYQPKLNVFEN